MADESALNRLSNSEIALLRMNVLNQEDIARSWRCCGMTRNKVCTLSLGLAVINLITAYIMHFVDHIYRESILYNLLIGILAVMASGLITFVFFILLKLDIKWGYNWHFIRTGDHAPSMGIRSTQERDTDTNLSSIVENIATINQTGDSDVLPTGTEAYNLRPLSSRTQEQSIVLDAQRLLLDFEHQPSQPSQVTSLNIQSPPRNPNPILEEEGSGQRTLRSNKITSIVTRGVIHVQEFIRKRVRTRSEPSVGDDQVLNVATEQQQLSHSEQSIFLNPPKHNPRSHNRPIARFGETTRRPYKITPLVTKGIIHGQEGQQVRRHTRSPSAINQEACVSPGQITEPKESRNPGKPRQGPSRSF